MKKCVWIVMFFLSPCMTVGASKELKIIKPKTSFFDYGVLGKKKFYGLYECDTWWFFSSFYMKKHRVDDPATEKLVFYIVPYQAYRKLETKKNIESFLRTITESYIEYQNERIRVCVLPCQFSRKFSLLYACLFRLGYEDVSQYWFTLLSDANKRIDMYCIPAYGFQDEAMYGTSHAYPIAILLDERNQIVSILDNVKSKRDIFKAFGFK